MDLWSCATPWVVAGTTALAMGCATPPQPPQAARRVRTPIVEDAVVHAFDTELETRLVDRLELDNFLRDRDIRLEVVDGVVDITGEVWTPLEKQRAADLLRHVAGVIEVVNHLEIRPPQ